MDARAAHGGRRQDFSATAARVLEHLRTSVGLEQWVVGRRQADEWVVLSSTDPAYGGLQAPWGATLCSVVHDGGASWATADVDEVPALAAARDGLGLALRTFVTVPLHGDGYRVLGTLCGWASVPGLPERADLLAELESFADVLGALLSAELRLEREARHRELAESAAETDALTGLGNRRRWDRQLSSEEERCRRYGGSAAVVTVDVDGLKAVNDLWGHDAGDGLLRQLAGVLRETCRPQDVVARLGGDEFAVLLAETGLAQAEAVVQRLVEALERASVPASVGLAVRGRDGLAGAWRDADARMYEDKRGRARSEPVQPVLSAPVHDPDREAVLSELLLLARRHTGADLTYVMRHEAGEARMRAIEAGDDDRFPPGFTVPEEGTYCHHRVQGLVPAAVADTREVELLQSLPVTALVPIGAYLGATVHLSDGRVYGTLCCVSYAPRPSFDSAAAVFLESVAASLGTLLGREEADRAGRRRTLADIDAVLAHDRLGMVYQPVLDLRTGAARGVEALARFEPGGRSTAEWFADAAAVERTSELELHAAATALREWRGAAGDLWLNLSASVLVSPAVTGLLQGTDLERLVVEISEHEQVDDYEQLRRALAPWRDRGLRLAVDDTGAGFASLRHVLELQPDVVKLDISLVQGLPDDPARRALLSALLAFAGATGAEVVAEGVETDEEVQALRSAGVHLGQGYHLGRPLPAAAALHPALSVVPGPRAGTARATAS